MSELRTNEAERRELADPAWQILNAPLDDEPETEDERSAVDAARSEIGPGTAHEEVLREFGL